MKTRRFLAVTVGVMVLSAGLVFMTDRAEAAAKDKSGVNPTQNSWDENLPSSSCFTVLQSFNNEAVRDNNTGLVWERAPEGTVHPWYEIFDSFPVVANRYCLIKVVGGTVGWRLPSVVELMSVQDPTLLDPYVPDSAFLIDRTGTQGPPGVRSANVYWSATTDAGNPLLAWFVDFHHGSAGRTDKTNPGFVWCVRGGMNADAY